MRACLHLMRAFNHKKTLNIAFAGGGDTMKINTKESIIVRPSQDIPQQRLWVSNMDLLHPRYYLPTVYLYKPNGSSDFFEAEVLKEALRKVLVPFYPVAGRLARDENGRVEINCNGEGVLLVVADPDSTTEELGNLVQVWWSLSRSWVASHSSRWNRSSPFHKLLGYLI
ncbi:TRICHOTHECENE 3-O-ACETYLTRANSFERASE [Salix koriyanagi]|uniref:TRICHOTHECENE 3-O-ACETYLTRANSFERASE n=1 Tax=Salix koriyanagi TaxID=2511006 RepID=A0A9Q0W6U5_9ROSI|nr:TRICHOTHECENE 3-O-ACETYLTRANSFERASE [Salix koriyanagi]